MLKRTGYRITKLVLEPEPGIELPALVFLPSEPAGNVYLYVDGRGKQSDAGPGGPIEKLVRQGNLVMAVDLRGMGETALRKKVSDYYLQDEEYYLAYLLGRSLVGMRAEDVLICARFLASYRTGSTPRRVNLVGIGDAGIPVLHAAALSPEMFASVLLRQTLASWSDVARNPIVKTDQLLNAVHGVLRFYDLPDLVKLIGPSQMRIEEPTSASGTVIGA